MTTFRGATSALFLIVASIGLVSGVSAKAAGPDKVHTDFGYVLVDPADVEAAVAEGTAVQEAARRVLALSDVRFAIVEEGSPGARWGVLLDDYVAYPWPFPNGSRRRSERPATRVLRHEIGHDLFERYLIPKSSRNRYGTDAPDWLDEMAAIAFEGSEEQAVRRRALRMGTDQTVLLPLPKLLSMVHPEFRSSSSTDNSQTVVTSAPSSSDTLRFYLTIQAFYDFLRSRTGNDTIVTELATAFMRNDDLGTWIATRVGIDLRDGFLESLDAQFRDWLATDTRYAK